MQQLIEQLAVDDLARLEPRILEQRLGNLVRRYVRHCSGDLAKAVVRHLEALYLHPLICRNPEQCCAYRRFASHWRLLAAQHGQSLA